MSENARQTKAVLTLQNIPEIDKGRIALAVNQAMRLCAQDIADRPADKTKRKVVFTIEMRPELDKQTAVLDTIVNEFTVETKVPKRRSAPYPMLPTPDGRQMFEPASPFDPRQQAFAYTNPTPTTSADPPDDMDPQTGEVPGDDDDEGEVSPM